MKVLSDKNTLLKNVPADITYLFQPLDIQGGPNRFVKRLMKRMSTDRYADQITKAMDEGKELESSYPLLSDCMENG